MAKKSLSSIKSGAFSRGFALAKVSMSAGAKAASHAVGNIFASEEDKPERFKAMLRSQLEALTTELGQLKGSLMKVGQMLSMYGEHVLPPEANALLKSLQSQSPPLEWNAIEKVLKRQLGPERLAQLEIDPDPVASASLGQVHLAIRKSDGKKIALKIQYPGVDAAIESDVKALRTLLSVSKLIPKGPKYDELFKEVSQMLHQEVDYENELQVTQEFGELLKDDPRYRVPEVFPEFSTGRVLATSFEEGLRVDDPIVQALPLERRKKLAEAFLDLYLREIFEWRMVQTDPHFGNYKIQLSNSSNGPDCLVLFDFGAARKIPKRFLDPYTRMVKGSFEQNRALVDEGAEGLGFFQPEDSEEAKQAFAELCYLIMEPFHSYTPYDWKKSDLPQRAMRAGTELAWKFRLRPPPREIVFLDRKMGGVYIFMAALDAPIDARQIYRNHLN